MAGAIDPNIILALNPGGGTQINPDLYLQARQQSADQQRRQQEQQLLMEKQQREFADEDDLRSAMSNAGTPQERVQNLYGIGRGKEAAAYEKHLGEQEAARLAQYKQHAEIGKQAFGAIELDPTEKNAAASLARFESMTNSTRDDLRDQLYSMGGDPNKIKQWGRVMRGEMEKLAPVRTTLDTEGAITENYADPYSLETIRSTTTPKTMSPYQTAQIENAKGNLQVAQRNAAVNEAELGLKKDKEGRESAADIKLQRQIAKEEKAADFQTEQILTQANSTLNNIDKVMGSKGTKADKAKGIKGTKGIESMINERTTGTYGKLTSYYPGSEADKLRLALIPIQSALGFGELEKMRKASPTGGALGEVSRTELEFLQSREGSLDLAQDPEMMKQTLREVAGSLKRLKDNIKAAREGGWNELPDPYGRKGVIIKNEKGEKMISDNIGWNRIP